MPDTELLVQWLLPTITVLFGVGGPIGAWVLLRKEMRQAPIEYRTAQVADAIAVSQAAKGLVDTVTARLSQQDARSEAQDRKIDDLRTALNDALADLHTKTGRLLRWDGWYDGLETDWEQHRLKPAPPEPPE